MERYESYKDSGVKWLGEIPSHWDSASLLYMLRAKISDGPHETPNLIEDGIPFISIDSLNNTKEIDFSVVKKYISYKDYERYCYKTKLERGDVLFSKAATIGKTAIVGDDVFMVWSPLAILKPNLDKISSLYLYYIMNCRKAIDEVSMSGSKNTQINVGMRELEKIRIPIPTIEEQSKITHFLEKGTNKIDAAIAQQQKMIDLLNERKQIIINNAVTKGLDPNVKMKPSGIDWIGEIPEHWEIKPLKYCARTNSGSTPRSISGKDNPKATIKWVRTTDLKNNHVCDTTEYLTLDEMKSTSCPFLPKGTVLISMYGGEGSFGKLGILDVEATINQALCSINCFDDILPEFIFFYLQAIHPLWMKYAASTRKDPNLNQETIKNIGVVLPPLREQQLIVNDISLNLNNIDIAINNVVKQISLLQERKQIIINDVVTGKVKVV